MKDITPETKQMLQHMTDGSAIPAQERRMLYRALERKMEEKDTPQALIEKFKACQGSHKKRPQAQVITSFTDSAIAYGFQTIRSRFELLKAFLLDPTMSQPQVPVSEQACRSTVALPVSEPYSLRTSVQIEVCYKEAAQSKNYNKHVEMPWWELEHMYGSTDSGRRFLEDIKQNQRGRPNPDKRYKKNAMYDLFKIYKGTETKSGFAQAVQIVFLCMALQSSKCT